MESATHRSKGSIHTANSNGDSGQPCLMPRVTANVSLNELLSRKLKVRSEHRTVGLSAGGLGGPRRSGAAGMCWCSTRSGAFAWSIGMGRPAVPVREADVDGSLVGEGAGGLVLPGTLRAWCGLVTCGRVALTRFANSDATSL